MGVSDKIGTSPDRVQGAVLLPAKSYFFALCESVIVLSKETMERAVDVSKP